MKLADCLTTSRCKLRVLRRKLNEIESKVLVTETDTSAVAVFKGAVEALLKKPKEGGEKYRGRGCGGGFSSNEKFETAQTDQA